MTSNSKIIRKLLIGFINKDLKQEKRKILLKL